MKNKSILCLVVVISIILLSVGFSAYQNILSIDDISLNVRVDKDVRIMGIKLDETNNSTSLYEEYNVKNINSKITLDSSDAYVIYDVSVYNLGNVYMGIKDITINNDNLKVEPINYTLKDKICENDKCTLGAKKVVKVKISYKDGAYNSENTSFDVQVNFDFKRIFNINYKNVTGDNLPTTIMEGDTLKVSFPKTGKSNLKIIMNNRFLNEEDFTYVDSLLTVPNVNGDVSITLQELTEMEKEIISNFVPSGNEDDVPTLDFGAMSHEERKNAFGSTSSTPEIYRTNSFSGKNDALVFRGNVTNNYVKFAGYTWRILQVDEDGNLRIIMDDLIAGGTHYNDTDSIASLEDAKKVLSFENSLLKEKLEKWKYYYGPWKDKVVKSNFCSDFDYVSKISSGSKNEVYYFKSYQNVGPDMNLYTPSLTCEKNSIFQSDVGAITAEEVVLAGGAFYKDNKNYFLYNPNITFDTWGISPSYYDLGRKNSGIFYLSANGSLKDYSYSLLKSYIYVRPVITIQGDVKMYGNGTKTDPYRYINNVVANENPVTDLSSLNNNKFYIASVVSTKATYGVLSDSVSNKLNNVSGLVGKDTAFFTDRKHAFTNYSGIEFSFENGKETNDGYLYQIKTDDGRYLRINSDKSTELTTEKTYCKITLVSDSNYKGQVVISNEDGSIYLNFYGSQSGEGDDKFAGWDEIDKNVYIMLFKKEAFDS